MAIEDWMPTLKTKLAAVTGVQQVHIYSDLPGSIMVFPSIVVLPTSGDQDVSAGGPNIAHHSVQATLYVAGQVLPEAYGQAVPFIKLVRNKIAANITLDGLVEHCLPLAPPQDWYSGPGEVRYGDKVHVGIIFRLDVKEAETVTVTA